MPIKMPNNALKMPMKFPAIAHKITLKIALNIACKIALKIACKIALKIACEIALKIACEIACDNNSDFLTCPPLATQQT